MLKAILTLLLLPILAKAQAEVRLGSTTISGRTLTSNVEFFGGIPYAEPPVGSLRLRKPVLTTRLKTRTFNASSYGPSCIQPNLNLTAISEDCLTINISRPKGVSSKQRLPVMFWTLGGAFFMGSSATYDGAGIVARSVARGTPIVFVNFNYRLGPLGFPQGKEADDRGALNLALHDQLAALEWVQANIHLFGGDKDKVTMFGESAGAMMVGIQLLNPRIGELARAAILQSGAANSPPSFRAERNEAKWQNFVSKVPSCASIASSGAAFSCLQGAPSEEIIAGIRSLEPAPLYNLTWTPTIDTKHGSVYPDYPSRLYSKGQFARLPFITGVNLDEGTLFASQASLSTDEMKAITMDLHSPPATALRRLGGTIDRALELYPEDPSVGSPYGTGENLFNLPASYKRHAALMGDILFHAPRREWSQVAAKAGVKGYGYLFTQPQAPPHLGVRHIAEIPYVFGGVPEADQGGRNLSTVMMDYWIAFSVSLNPNDGKGEDRPSWPEFTTRNKVLLKLEAGNLTTVPDDYRKEQIEYLNRNALVLSR